MLSLEEILIGLGVIALIVMIMMASSSKKNREYFGGIIKSNKNIPRTTCYNLCDNRYNQCMFTFGNVDPGRCVVNRSSCRNVCDYSTWNYT